MKSGRLSREYIALHIKAVILFMLFILSFIVPSESWSTVPNINDPVARIYTIMKIDSIRQNENSILNLHGERGLIEPETQVYDLYRSIGDTLSIEYCATAYGLSYLHFLLGDPDVSSSLCEESLRIYNKIGIKQPQLYTGILSVLGGSYFRMGRYNEAIEVYEINKGTYNDISPTQLDAYALLLSDLAQLYTQVENYSKAIENSTECISIINNNKMHSSFAYISALNTEGVIGRATGNYASAQSAYEKALNLLDSFPSNDQTQTMFQMIATNLSWTYHMMGDNDKAIDLVDKLIPKIDALNDVNRAAFYQNTAQVLIQSLDMSEMRNDSISDTFMNISNRAIDYQKKAIEIHANIYGEESPEFLMSISALAGIYGNFGNFDEVIKIESVIDSICTNNNQLYGSKSHQLALCHLLSGHLVRFGFDERYYSNKNEIQLSAKYADRLMKIMRSSTDDGITPLAFFDLCARAYIGNNEYYKAIEAMICSFHRKKYRLSVNAPNISDESKRNAYWDYTTSSLLSPVGFYEPIKDDDSIGSLFYDIALLYKGAKLTLSSKEHTNILFESSWKTIRESLKSNEIAIEFMRIEPDNEGLWEPSINEPFYIALSIKKNNIKPVLTYLCTENEILSIDYTNRYSTDSIYNMIWEPIMKELKDVNIIYFSPMGELNNIAIEYLPININKTSIQINSKYNLYRLSSTRTLLESALTRDDFGVSALFGGMKYSETPNISEYSTPGNHISRSCLDDLKQRKGFSDLNPATFDEVSNIANMFASCSYPYKLYTGLSASESAMRSLSGSAISIIHIATHGFYWSEFPQFINHDKLSYITENNEIYVEDESMMRSGLLFSGANQSISSGNMFGSGDDGIMTAHEIAQMDYSGVELAVLSACQTGLGEIKGDGVYGLQRAFKIAGVNSLLMSLWEVDNDATQILMEAFYRSLLRGKTKRQALIDAQFQVKRTPGFEDPEYWAAFILLDGIN